MQTDMLVVCYTLDGGKKPLLTVGRHKNFDLKLVRIFVKEEAKGLYDTLKGQVTESPSEGVDTFTVAFSQETEEYPALLTIWELHGKKFEVLDVLLGDRATKLYNKLTVRQEEIK